MRWWAREEDDGGGVGDWGKVYLSFTSEFTTVVSFRNAFQAARSTPDLCTSVGGELATMLRSLTSVDELVSSQFWYPPLRLAYVEAHASLYHTSHPSTPSMLRPLQIQFDNIPIAHCHPIHPLAHPAIISSSILAHAFCISPLTPSFRHWRNRYFYSLGTYAN